MSLSCLIDPQFIQYIENLCISIYKLMENIKSITIFPILFSVVLAHIESGKTFTICRLCRPEPGTQQL